MRKAGFVLALAALVLLAWIFFRSKPTTSPSEQDGAREPTLGDTAWVESTDEGGAAPGSDDAEPSVAVGLTVVDESGGGVPGARIGVFGPECDGFGFLDAICQAHADKEGRLEISIPARARDLSLRACPPDCREDLVEVRRALWTPRRRETIVLPAARSISGLVVAPDGSPVPEAGVVWSAGDVDDAGVLADGEGRFILHGLPPGKVTLTALPKDWAMTRAAGDPRVVETGREDVILVLRPDESLIGRISNWPRGGRRRAELTVQHPPGVERRWTVRIDQDGRFKLSGLRPQLTYLIWVGAIPRTAGRKPSRDDPAPFIADLHTSDLQVEVLIPRGLTIEGRLLRPPGGLESRVWAWNQEFMCGNDGVIEEDGRFLISGLFPGRWRVRAETLYGRGERASPWGTDYDEYERYEGSATVEAGDRVDIPMERE